MKFLVLSLLVSIDLAPAKESRFFQGYELQRNLLVPHKDSKFDDGIAEKVWEKGIGVLSLKDHFMSEDNYVRAKANQEFPVLYFDVDVHRDKLGWFTFDIHYIRGSEFESEGPQRVVKGCLGRRVSDQVKIVLTDCLAKE